MQLLVIAGHGAGDPGAVGNGHNEADMVRSLSRKIKERGGDSVILGDMSRNYYADNGISKLTYPKDTQILELHMDSAAPSAKGAHIIIKSGIGGPDEYDRKLADNLAAIFPGRANKIVERSDLANPNRAAAKGYPYRLAEVGFITNANDSKTFIDKQTQIADTILQAFNINPIKEVEEMTPADFWKYTIGLKHGNGKMTAEDILAWIEYNTADDYSINNKTTSASKDGTTGKWRDRLDFIDQRVREMYDKKIPEIDKKLDQILKKLG